MTIPVRLKYLFLQHFNRNPPPSSHSPLWVKYKISFYCLLGFYVTCRMCFTIPQKFLKITKLFFIYRYIKMRIFCWKLILFYKYYPWELLSQAENISVGSTEFFNQSLRQIGRGVYEFCSYILCTVNIAHPSFPLVFWRFLEVSFLLLNFDSMM